ncbi:hypothetical protein PAAG_12053 [Paracoccidioides lutzii Pb01]|uniref:Uncharacterized protein n=1 Tax=Paracoccidioides lutzii (strain ATCC MYA-826 / Pb01) TaxID=502779 RepID=A0A0A2V4K1_PARBA|nr:hypothetical protein PAAG_12053 [Paracoccidioides lutzii Pb01]KGQ01282.1 hypothetical protein PAAG_12053 [Paracoccidioides lutzii Pb01]
MLEILDGDYTPYQGYHFDCAAAQADVHRGGRNRQLSRLIFIIHHKAEDDSNYRWTKEWLERRFGFEEQALLKGTGYKMGEWLNSATWSAPPGISPTEHCQKIETSCYNTTTLSER